MRSDLPTPRELIVTTCLMRGWSNKRIAKELGVDEKTVKFHITSILLKHGLKTRYELMAKIFEEKITEDELRTFKKILLEANEMAK